MFRYKPHYDTLMNARYAGYFKNDVLIAMDNGDVYRVVMTPRRFENLAIITPEEYKAVKMNEIHTHHLFVENGNVVITYFYENKGAIAFQVDDKDFIRVSVF